MGIPIETVHSHAGPRTYLTELPPPVPYVDRRDDYSENPSFEYEDIPDSPEQDEIPFDGVVQSPLDQLKMLDRNIFSNVRGFDINDPHQVSTLQVMSLLIKQVHKDFIASPEDFSRRDIQDINSITPRVNLAMARVKEIFANL